jgi:predicted Zn-dependent protease with MMP-like domain
MMLRRDQTLFGLYEGIPLTQRGAGYNLVLPDKITIFKNPIVMFAPNLESLKKQVRHTVWHEIAHHYGLNHKRIHEVEKELGISQHY